MNFRRGREAAERHAERRRREDESPRLKDVAPTLDTLRLEVHETRGEAPVAEAAHIRRVVVEHAPALFLLPCGDSSCKDGGHDITRAVLRGLESKTAVFEGDDACGGHTGTASCPRVLHFTAHATYKG